MDEYHEVEICKEDAVGELESRFERIMDMERRSPQIQAVKKISNQLAGLCSSQRNVALSSQIYIDRISLRNGCGDYMVRLNRSLD
jgi:hypothetical protein